MKVHICLKVEDKTEAAFRFHEKVLGDNSRPAR